MFKFLGIVLIVVALAMAVVPNFTDCESQGGMITLANGKLISMKCHWAGRAEIPVGLSLLVVGGMMAFNRRRVSLVNLSVLGIILSGFALAVPTFLIGTCTTPTMVCNTVMKPALLSLGGVGMVTSIGAVFAAWNKKDELA